jgi:RimJ/RimL family protein N-acetyltransferase
MNTIIKNPSDCNQHELASFEDLVRKGGEVVADGLSGRIRNAAFLMFLTKEDGSLIGISALKHPNPGYRARIFKKAGSKLRPEDFTLELGWVFVVETERGNKYSRLLVEQILPQANTERVYCTTRELNEAMIKTVGRYGFRGDGVAYRSDTGDYNLRLFVC